MSFSLDNLALLCPPGGFDEPRVQVRRQGNVGPTGMQVSTSRFLDAYLHHGTAKKLTVVLANRQDATAFDRRWKDHPATKARRLERQPVGAGVFHQVFFPNSPARVLHSTGLLSPANAWSRSAHGPHAFALSGVLRSLASVESLRGFAELLAAPLMPFDALVCPSQATRAAAVSLFDSLGQSPAKPSGCRPRLEVIPWGVDAQRFRPATPEQKGAARTALGIAADEFVVLTTGRLSFHTRANPYPLYHGLYQAARVAQKKVRLLLTGWAANEHIQAAFLDGARVFAPTVTTTHVLGAKPEELQRASQAADLFSVFPDSYEESHALTLLEAMAAGLPVVASDWAGYRDLVSDEAGVLVPTCIVPGAAPEATTRLLQGEINQNSFLAQTSQTVVVDCAAAVRAFSGLMASAERRRDLGTASRRRIEAGHTWQKVIAAYDRLWTEQEQVRAAHEGRESNRTPHVGYPAPEDLFAGHATRLVADDDLVQGVPENESRLHRLGKVAMTSFSPETRCTDPVVLRRVLDAAAMPVPVRELDGTFRQAGVGRSRGRATLAWMLKYGLLMLLGPAVAQS